MESCRECGRQGANLLERLNRFCSNACADRFFNTWALRELLTIAQLPGRSGAKDRAKAALRKWGYLQ